MSMLTVLSLLGMVFFVHTMLGSAVKKFGSKEVENDYTCDGCQMPIYHCECKLK